MSNIEDLEKRVHAIEQRNKRVEQDKAWETSWSRKIAILITTYVMLAIYFAFVLRVNPWINAIVPTIGFFLSTLSLPFFKRLWSTYIHNK